MRVFERIVVSRIYKAKAIIITLLICSICAKPIRRLLSWDSEAAINNVTAGGKSDLKPISHLASKREWWLGILRSTQLPSWPHPYPQALHLRPTNKLEVGGNVNLKSSVRFLSAILFFFYSQATIKDLHCILIFLCNKLARPPGGLRPYLHERLIFSAIVQCQCSCGHLCGRRV